MEAIGRRRWAIPEGYIPSESSYSDRELVSHETACILNAADRDAHVTLIIFFADREPVGPYRVTVAARRTCTCVSMTSMIHSRSRATPTMPQYSNRTFRSSCNTRGSIPAALKSPFCQPLLTRKDDSRNGDS